MENIYANRGSGCFYSIHVIYGTQNFRLYLIVKVLYYRKLFPLHRFAHRLKNQLLVFYFMVFNEESLYRKNDFKS